MDNELDFSTFPNPYDFSHPVADSDAFSGREAQVAEIRYYLNQASIAARPTNIALLGPRAAGKTSLLNFIEWESKQRQFCVARVALNEDDVKSELEFFWKTFDAVLSAACSYERTDSSGEAYACFEGRTGKTYQAYVDMTTVYEVPTESEWTPFTFPTLYAKVKSRGRSDASVPEPRFTEDLTLISHEVGHPIVILYDECNVLVNSRVLLQRLRNIFMNLSGYMVVLTGTPELFPVMDEVFSPIARDFKRIEVDAFDSEQEAEDCVERPLRGVGIDEPRKLFDRETYQDLVSDQGVSGQRPYEIQLLCHFLFRAMQQGRLKAMRLNVEVLDEVLKELGRGRDITARPTILKIRGLDEERLRALAWLCRSNGYATFEQLWFVEYVFFGNERFRQEALRQQLEVFQQDRVINVRDGIIHFEGDDFDRIYSKYYAKRRKVRLQITELSVPALFAVSFALKRMRHAEGGAPMSISVGASDYSRIDTMRTVEQVVSELQSGVTRLDLLEQNLDLLEIIYKEMFDADRAGGETLRVKTFSVEAESLRRTEVLFLPSNADAGGIWTALEDMGSRAEDLGATVGIESAELAIVPRRALLAAISQIPDKHFRESITDYHGESSWYHYLRQKDVNAAIEHERHA